MLHVTPRHSTTASAIRRAAGLVLARAGRLMDRWIAAVIARQQRQADLWHLGRLGDRELRDIGLTRSDLGAGLAEAAKSRIQKQQTGRS
jgi:uncharacterized protein YjiS (DUF1127 family)